MAWLTKIIGMPLSCCNPLEHVGLMDAAAPVQRRERFIEQQQIRLGQQRLPMPPADVEAAREAVGGCPSRSAKPKGASESSGCQRPSPDGPPVAGCRAPSDGKEARILKHQPDRPRFRQGYGALPIAPPQGDPRLASSQR